MNILERIIIEKRREVELKKVNYPETILRSRDEFLRPCYSIKEALEARNSTGIIAEFKRKSPSKGWIREKADVSGIVREYSNAGASAISILTDESFFGGLIDDLVIARKILSIPILRKDFIIDEYQVIESKSYGADVILLIAACLTQEEVKTLAGKAKNIGLEVLLEIHNEAEINHICNGIDIVGVNNRDLKSFEVDINRSIKLAPLICSGKILISESGLYTTEDVVNLRYHGYKGFLMGEKFMKEEDPGFECVDFIAKLKLINED